MTIPTTFLDGVLFLESKLAGLASALGLASQSDREAKMSGYHAIHAYVTLPVGLPTPDGVTADQLICVEIQLRTRLQETLWQITHRMYERARLGMTPSITAWDFRDHPNEFAATYIGHQVQYLEAALIELRKADD